MKRVLILDANQRSALAATRSLGKKGITLITGDSTAHTLAGASTFSSGSVVYPSPYAAPQAFLAAVADAVVQHNIDVLFPMTDVTMAMTLMHRQTFLPTLIAGPDFEIYDSVTDKFRLFKLAESLGLPMPATTFCDPTTAPFVPPSDLHLPLVLKPARSRVLRDDHWVSTAVKIAHSRPEMQSLMEQYAWFQHSPYLIQEFVTGQGQGIFALYDHGRPLAFFAHKRIREKPPEGGVSVLSESTAVVPRMREIAEAILTPIKWHGVAMVEFKVSEDGTPYLMEINGRFWGSLQLAVDAGVDFPYMLYQLSQGEPIVPVTSYTTGLRSRWLLGDLDHLYLKLKTGHGHWHEKLSAISAFLHPFPAHTRYEINRLDDLGPFLFELRKYFAKASH